MDIVDAATRSRMMSRIRSRDTRPEMIVRRALHAAGFRYRLHVRSLPGSPDIVLPKHRAVILVHGCFWHRHEHCSKTTTPSSNVGQWSKKFGENVARDKRARKALLRAGWRVGTVWECGVSRDRTAKSIEGLTNWLLGNEREFETRPEAASP